MRLAELEADGLAENTIVFFFGDNGGVLPRSQALRQRRRPARAADRPLPAEVPPPGAGRPGSVVRDPVSCVDFPPTLLSLAGVRVPDHMDGEVFLGKRVRPRRVIFGQRSRMDERYDLQRAVRDERYLYIRNYMPHRPYGQNMGYMWQQRGYQDWEQAHLDGDVTPLQEAFWDEKAAEELYDLERDPDQVSNLAGLAAPPGRAAAAAARARRAPARDQRQRLHPRGLAAGGP